ncbi:testis-expressed protein 10 [Trichonephila clavata]|uniref:Testis-expressed protein 10 n=1 Tax=Trichonephila clavata TaxID=2740835 RepID=A0A8X6HBK8_TRICU|nr:testis-expressed protein 10 [Trichonephila clavata]
MEAEESCLCTFELYVHPVSKKHLEIFEVCFNCLIPYIRSNVAADCIVCFVKSFCFQDTKLPAHSAIAIMELRNRISFLYHDEELNTIVNEICFSSTVYMSYAANAAPEEGWDNYLLPQFQESLNRLDVQAMLQVIEQKLSGYGKNEMFLVFKVINYLFKRTLDKNMIYEFLEKIGVNCREDLALSKMWMDLCKIWMR